MKVLVVTSVLIGRKLQKIENCPSENDLVIIHLSVIPNDLAPVTDNFTVIRKEDIKKCQTKLIV